MLDWILALSYLCGIIVISLAGMFLVRRKVQLSTLESHNDVAGFIYTVVGCIFAVLAAFVTIVVYNQFKISEERVEREAMDVGNLYRISEMYPDPIKNEIRGLLTEYNKVMIEKEFPAMAKGMFSPESKVIHDKLWGIFYRLDPKDDNGRVWFSQGLEAMKALAEDKRLRMSSVKYEIPAFMWFVLYFMGFVTIVYSYFFGTKNVWSHGLLVVLLSGTVALVLILISALEHPFQGLIHVKPEPFELLLQYFK